MATSPWLDIPLDDYEGHMSLPTVGQAALIADLLGRAIMRCSPARIAVIGCAGGNGLERITPGTVEQIVALDLNPDYVEQTRLRHSWRLRGLEPLCADIQSESLWYGPVDFTYAALLFEYVDLRAALLTIRRNSRPNATLTTVLQLAHSTLPSVSTSPYTSLARVARCMRLVAPEVLSKVALQVGFACADSETVELPSGKKFCVQNFTT